MVTALLVRVLLKSSFQFWLNKKAASLKRGGFFFVEFPYSLKWLMMKAFLIGHQLS